MYSEVHGNNKGRSFLRTIQNYLTNTEVIHQIILHTVNKFIHDAH